MESLWEIKMDKLLDKGHRTKHLNASFISSFVPTYMVHDVQLGVIYNTYCESYI
uniref:Uncharacterized protein n=1 Tax=Arundo donax TaxID=35708 RepID=A0A0A9B5G3_ARUDO